VAVFAVVQRQRGPKWDVSRPPWSEDLLLIASIEPWTIRLGELS
jgi:hypothetical protein